MTTEQHIRDTFKKQFPNGTLDDAFMFAAGYLALLNGLIPPDVYIGVPMYRLPEGVTKS